MKTGMLFLLAAIGSALAGEPENLTFTNKTGVVVKDAKVIKVVADGIFYRTPNGGGKVLFKDLPLAVKAEFGYDPKKETAYLKEQGMRQEQEAKIAAERAQKMAVEEAQDMRFRQIMSSRLLVGGRILQKVREGFLIHSFPSTEDGHAVTGVSHAGDGTPIYVGLCLLTDHPDYSRLVDNDKVKIVVYPAGEYTYTTTQGAQKTIRKFTANSRTLLR